MDDELYRAVGRLEGKVDILLARSEKADAEGDARGARITKLEQDAAAQKAVVGVIGVIAGGISAFVTKLFGYT
jgi:hypothetical protein